MKRIILIVIRILYLVPYWLGVLVPRYKDTQKYSHEQRYMFMKEKVSIINKKARVKVQTYGLENLPEQSGYLMTPNHQGLEDPVAIVQTHPTPARAIVKIELTKVFLMKDIITILDCIPMDRDDVRGSVRIIKQAANAIKEGQNFFVFPEGTRCKNKNEMLDFKGGTFKIATSSRAPIVPVAIIDSYKVFDVPSIQPVTVQIHYLPAIYYDEYKDMNTNEIAVMVQQRIKECIQTHEK
ncbi:lysophospholipid acyltransferase family protein [Tannockella kyphosi]|uniref:lysophospholipid acyltransferase family protein n=1 Tax=Tannockella kyphosi TaxID=2899121 RepID=UPI002012A139|nr:lysophospholipid acyltransferase family protein [Tannockella kyphosi]